MHSPASDSALTTSELTSKMRSEWDERARENARHYVATGKVEWNDEEYFESGRENVRREILTDMINICQGKDPREMTVLEIGCGSGRITRALSELFGQVYAVDISGEMIRQAQQSLEDRPNAHVFQHIPSREVISSYVRDVHRLLRPGGLFKFQVQGGAEMHRTSDDTWFGVPF